MGRWTLWQSLQKPSLLKGLMALLSASFFFFPPQVWTKSEQPSNVSRSQPILSRLCNKSSNDRSEHYSHLLLKSATRNVFWSVLLPSSRAVAEILLRLREKQCTANSQMMERRKNMDEAPSSPFCPTWKFVWVNPNSINRYSSQVVLPPHLLTPSPWRVKIPHSPQLQSYCDFAILSPQCACLCRRKCHGPMAPWPQEGS